MKWHLSALGFTDIVCGSAPGKMTMRNAQFVEKLFLGRWSIAYLMRGSMRSYGPAHWLDYYDTPAIMCAWYYTCCIQQTWNQAAKSTSLHAPKYALKYTPDCTRLQTPSLLDLGSQVHLLVCTQVRSQLHSMVTPSLLDYTLPSKLSRRSQVHLRVYSQVHSRACSQVCSQLHSMARSQPAWL